MLRHLEVFKIKVNFFGNLSNGLLSQQMLKELYEQNNFETLTTLTNETLRTTSEHLYKQGNDVKNHTINLGST